MVASSGSAHEITEILAKMTAISVVGNVARGENFINISEGIARVGAKILSNILN